MRLKGRIEKGKPIVRADRSAGEPGALNMADEQRDSAVEGQPCVEIVDGLADRDSIAVDGPAGLRIGKQHEVRIETAGVGSAFVLAAVARGIEERTVVVGARQDIGLRERKRDRRTVGRFEELEGRQMAGNLHPRDLGFAEVNGEGAATVGVAEVGLAMEGRVARHDEPVGGIA